MSCFGRTKSKMLPQPLPFWRQRFYSALCRGGEGSSMAKQELEKYVLLVLGVWALFFILTMIREHHGFLRHILPN